MGELAARGCSGLALSELATMCEVHVSTPALIPKPQELCLAFSTCRCLAVAASARLEELGSSDEEVLEDGAVGRRVHAGKQQKRVWSEGRAGQGAVDQRGGTRLLECNGRCS